MHIKYGLEFPDDFSEEAMEFYCFSEWWDAERGGLGRYGHLRNIFRMVWPDREWTPWDDIRARQFCSIDNWKVNGNERFHCQGNVGCAASAKTDFWASVGVAWWLSDPLNSAVAITSIHKKMVRQRSWSIIQARYHQCEVKVGNFVDSQMEWQAKKGDSKHAIHALAVGGGETQKAMQVIAGLHCPRIMLIIDEAPGTPEAIFHAVTNLRKGAQEFVIVAAGNAISRMDAHGRICEPKDGWNTIDEDTEVWDTAGVPEWSIEPGVCIHFAGKRSPNVKAGKTIFPFLYTYENYLQSKGREDTLLYWAYDAGFWPPEGICRTVFDEATVQRVGGMDKVTWEGGYTAVASLDPAFGGDECVFRLGKVGKPASGPDCLEVGQKFVLKLKQKSPVPVHYQIARQAIDLCNKHGVKPENFGIDCTGNGGGVASVMEAEWSPLIHKVEFGGKPTEYPVSSNDGRPCNEVYDRRVTELWFNARELLDGGQLKGLDRETIVQFCKRTYDLDTRKKRIETKDECKERMGRSPDDADAVAVLCDVARKRGLAATGIPRSKSKTERYMEVARQADDVYTNDDDNPFVQESGKDLFAWAEE